MTTTRIALASAASLLLAGCISFGAKPPESLLSLTPTATVAAGTAINGDVAQAIQVVMGFSLLAGVPRSSRLHG